MKAPVYSPAIRLPAVLALFVALTGEFKDGPELKAPFSSGDSKQNLLRLLCTLL